MQETKSHQPIISVVMPVYNAEFYLEEAITSILNQTYKNFEFIIIDDGSNDNSLEIIQKASSKDSRIICISRENKGIIYSLNEGIKLSKGSYIARMDADDISYPDRFEEQYKFMLDNNLDICGGNYISINKDGLFKKLHEVPKEGFEILLTMASSVPFAHPSVMIKKSFLTNHELIYGTYGFRSAEDLDLWISMYYEGARFGNIGTCILQYRLLSNSLSSIKHGPIKREVKGQFDLFVNKNHESIRLALLSFCNQKSNTSIIQRVAIKALLRYLSVDLDFMLLYKCWRKVSLYNFIFGFLSYINSRILFK
jgi:glycosyltransferase involved in cell wall biosynthesis|tara:strand:+ start:400 stop:1329 length:930 start_codon:yes stop_codon:yes gene_type:complete